MKRSCELCGSTKKIKKAILKVLGVKGIEMQELDMCEDCIAEENATVKYPKKSKKAA